MRVRLAILVLACLAVQSSPAIAQTEEHLRASSDNRSPDATPPAGPVGTTRPRMLAPMYLTFASLQGIDVYLTARGLARGASEANPLAVAMVSHPGTFVAVKAASTAGSIYLTERLWRTHRITAILTMIAVNGLMASVDVRNASSLSNHRP